MGIYNDLDNTEKVVDNFLAKAQAERVDEVKEPVATNIKDAVAKMYDVLKTLRAIQYTIKNDDKITDETYLGKLEKAIENVNSAVVEVEPIGDKLKELGF